MKIIGLSGYARAGKDTVAHILADHGWERHSFADRLKLAVKELDPMIGLNDEGEPMTLSDVWNWGLTEAENWEYLKDNYPEARRSLQRMGTEVGRKTFGDNFWVEQAFLAIGPNVERVIFTDCRFLNEALAITERGGEVWRIRRDGCKPVNNHPSETSLDDYDFHRYIDNDGTLEDLAQQVFWTEKEMFECELV